MGVYKLSASGGPKAGRTEYSSMLAGNPVYVEPAMELITSQILTSNSAGVLSLNDIPQNYKHLQIRAVMRSTFNSGENLYIRLNGQTYSYSGHYLYGNGSSATAGGYTSANYADMIGMANTISPSGLFSCDIIDILDYSSSSKYKTIRSIGGGVPSNIGVNFKSNLATTTDPITSISQIGGTAGTSLVAGTRVSIYGIRG